MKPLNINLITLQYCVFTQILLSILDCDDEQKSLEQYIVGIILIVFSELVLIGSISFNYKLSKPIFWTLFCLKLIGMILMFNSNMHQIVLFSFSMLSQLIYFSTFQTLPETSDFQQTYNQVNSIIQQFLDSQNKWSKQMRIRLQFIQGINTNKQISIKEQFQIEKILSYSINSDMWRNKFNKYIMLLQQIYKEQFIRFSIVNQRLKNNFQILVSRLNSYSKKLEEENEYYIQIQTISFKDKNHFNQDSLSLLDCIRSSQSKIIEWLNNEESPLNETINILLKEIELIKEQLHVQEQQFLLNYVNQFADLLMSLNFDKQQLAYNIIQQQSDLRQLKHKYIRRLNKIKAFQQKVSECFNKEIEFNQFNQIETYFKDRLNCLILENNFNNKEKIIFEIMDEIMKIYREKLKLEDENISLKGLITQTDSQIMFEESQRLLTKNDESFSHSKICTHR